jgi:hypothetical protein
MCHKVKCFPVSGNAALQMFDWRFRNFKASNLLRRFLKHFMGAVNYLVYSMELTVFLLYIFI